MSNAPTRLPRAVWLMDRNELENEVVKLRAEGDELESALAQARDELAKEREAIAVWCDGKAKYCDSVGAGARPRSTQKVACEVEAGAFRECAAFVRNRSNP